jgi:cytochrome c55X
MSRSAWLALSLFLALPLFASTPAPPAVDRQRELRNLLIQDCGSCHGLRLRGGLGPALLAEQLRGKSADYISSVILQGRPGSAMPGWSPLLTDAEARWIAELLLQGQALAESGS